MTRIHIASTNVLLFLAIIVCSTVVSAQTPKWEPTGGPYGAVCQDLVQTASGIYLMSDERNGVWRSTDSCAHWELSSTGISSRNVYALARADDGSILAGTHSGIFRSSNDGNSWEERSTGMTSKNTKDIVVLSDGTILATAWGGGIYRSTDEGQLWTESNNGLTQLSIYCLRIHTNDHVFAGSFGNGVFRSTDKGQSWTALPLSGYIYDIGVRPDGVLLALSHNTGLFLSSDNGDTWVKSDQGLPSLSGQGFAARSNSEVLFGVSAERGMYRSVDGGSTWSAYADGYSLASTKGLRLMPDGDCFAMTNGDGVYRLPKDSVRWRAQNTGVQGTWIYALESASDSIIFAGGYGGVWVTRDQGVTWSHTDLDAGSMRVADLLYTKQMVFTVGYSGGIRRSTDLGKHWTPINTGSTAARPSCLTVDSGGTLYCGSDGDGMFSSTNGGDTWQPASNGLTSLRVHALCADASVTLYASTDDGVFKSTNQGASWSLASNGLASTRCYALSAANGFVFAGASTGVFRSSDNGSNWTKVGVGQIPSRAHHAIRIDDSGAIYAGGAGSVWTSTDNGDTWQSPGSGFPSSDVHDFAFLSHGQVFAATEGNGVYRLPVGSGESEITIRTSPEGRSFTVDGTTYSSAQTFTWQSGSTHTISTIQMQSGVTGIRYNWESWSDGGARSHSVITPPAALTITAVFDTEYQLTMNTSGAGSVTPQTGWLSAGENVSINALPDSGQRFDGWEGTGEGSYSGPDNPATVTMNGPITEIAYFAGTAETREISVTTDPPGRRMTVDGESFSSQRTFSWQVGSRHDIGTTSPQGGSPGLRYVWKSWSNGEGITHTWTVPSGPALTITASFDMEYQLTMTAENAGSVSPTTGWHANGAQVQLLATPHAGYAFDRWEGTGQGSYSGTDNPVTITIRNPVSESAFFRQVTGVVTGQALPETVVLHQNAPNPLSDATTISFSLVRAQPVSLVVMDVLGHVMMRPVEGAMLPAGKHQCIVNLSGFPSGLYFYRLVTPNGMRLRAMVLQR